MVYVVNNQTCSLIIANFVTFLIHCMLDAFLKCILFKTTASVKIVKVKIIVNHFLNRLGGVRLEEEKRRRPPPAGRLQPVFLSEGKRRAAAAAVPRPQEQIQLQPVWTSLREALQRLRVQESREEGADAELLLPLLRLCPASTTSGGGRLRRCRGHYGSCFVWHQHVTSWCLDFGATRSDEEGLDRFVPSSLLETSPRKNMTVSIKRTHLHNHYVWCHYDR